MQIGKFNLRGNNLKLKWRDYQTKSGERRKAIGTEKIADSPSEYLQLLRHSITLDEMHGDPSKIFDFPNDLPEKEEVKTEERQLELPL